ncbi:hypothetical protein OX958_30860 [Kribbella sp. CA-293567]|nr:hypothetical protein [Kribbella sp. CA-293567]WBQ04354.1 hypothetical protein OX958_30860 [Kribbella sp. CA-293567]
MQGTSMVTPQLTGVLALSTSRNPLLFGQPLVDALAAVSS